MKRNLRRSLKVLWSIEATSTCLTCRLLRLTSTPLKSIKVSPYHCITFTELKKLWTSWRKISLKESVRDFSVWSLTSAKLFPSLVTSIMSFMAQTYSKTNWKVMKNIWRQLCVWSTKIWWSSHLCSTSMGNVMGSEFYSRTCAISCKGKRLSRVYSKDSLTSRLWCAHRYAKNAFRSRLSAGVRLNSASIDSLAILRGLFWLMKPNLIMLSKFRA